MIDLLENLYGIVMSGITISAVIGALIYWYAISININDKDDFDKKYRGSRKTKGRW
jgi:energy-converting hydrogenase Eha subunit G